MTNKQPFYSLTNPPPMDLDNEDYTDIPSLADPSQDEPIGVIVKKLLSGTLRVPPSDDIVYDVDDITAVKNVDDFMTANERVRPGYSDLSDTQVYAELAKETIERLKSRSTAQKKESEPLPPSDSKKSESEESLDRSNESLNGNGK